VKNDKFPVDLITVEFFGEKDKDDAVIAYYDGSKSEDEISWTCEEYPKLIEILERATQAAITRVNFLSDPDPNLLTVKEVIRIMKTGKILNAPEEPAVEENVVY